MLVDKQSELMSDLLFTVHQHGGDDVTWKPPITFFLEVNRFLIVNFFDFIFLAPCCDGTFTYNLLWDRPSSYKVFYLA